MIVPISDKGVTADATTARSKAMKAYKAFMKTRSASERFAVAYIDDDSVPELILDRNSTGSRLSGFGDFYTFKDNRIFLIDNNLCLHRNKNISYNGSYFKYYKKTGIYLDDDSIQGCRITSYYKFKKTTATCKASKLEYESWTGVEPSNKYKKGSKTVRKSTYTTYVNKLKKGKSLTNAKLYKNTEKNRNIALK